MQNIKLKKIEDLDGYSLLYYYKKSSSLYIEDIETSDDKNLDNFDNDYLDKEEYLKEEAEDILFKKLGRSPTDDEKNEYARKFLEEEYIDNEIYKDEYGMISQKEGAEILEVGDDYGELPQGIEDEGNGVVDDLLYIEEMKQDWEEENVFD